jgi:putative ABC transport system permease protein
MLSIESIRYSLRNLWHRKSRSFLTVFSVLIGIATIFIFVSFGYGLYNYTQELAGSSSADKIIVLAKGAGVPGLSEFKLTDKDLDAIEKSSGVYDATGLYFETIELKKGKERKYTFLISGDAKKTELILEMFNIGVEKGRFLQEGDNGKAVLGYNYLVPKKIFEKPLEINDKIEVNDHELKVIGFLNSIGNPQDDSQIYITNDYFLEMFPEKDSYAQIIARVDVSNIEGIISNVERNLRKSRNLEKGKEDFFVQSFEDLIESFSGALNVIIGFVVLIALVSIVVSAINTANTMITSVLERYREIGILKSVGAKNRDIFGIFLFESAFLGFIAGILGIALGYSVTFVAGNLLKNLGWGFIQPYYSMSLFIGLMVFAIVTGAISGIAPTIKASKINVVDALRYE